MVQLGTVRYGSETRCIHTAQSCMLNCMVAEACIMKLYALATAKTDAMLAFCYCFTGDLSLQEKL